jgi:predicted nucleic-acid-binding protein
LKTYVIDTNALLSFVTDRNPDQQEIMSTIFNQAIRLDCKILCHVHVITEFVYVLEKVYGHEKPSIRQMVMDFMLMPGIEIKHDIDLKILLEYWPNLISDFGDGVVASLWSKHPEAIVATFDKRFIKELLKINAQVLKRF